MRTTNYVSPRYSIRGVSIKRLSVMWVYNPDIAAFSERRFRFLVDRYAGCTFITVKLRDYYLNVDLV